MILFRAAIVILLQAELGDVAEAVEASAGGVYNPTTVNDQVGWLGAARLGVVGAWCGWRFSVEGPAGRRMARRGAARAASSQAMPSRGWRCHAEQSSQTEPIQAELS